MASAALRKTLGLATGLLLTSFLLSSCSLFQRDSSEPGPVTDRAQPESTIAGDEPAIQTPEQADADPNANQESDMTSTAEDTQSGLHLVWGYSGVIGPEMWHKLDPSFKQCGSGNRQSPIDLRWSRPKQGALEISYSNGPMAIIDTGHGLQVNFEPGNTVTIRGETYELEQLHFHSSSEHTLSGNSLPMEAHFIHKNKQGELAVLGVILIEGQSNPTIQKIWQNWPVEKGNVVHIERETLNPEELIPKIKTHYHYVGSLTTPPCTEGVSWNVLNTPLELSKEQLLTFRKHYSSNSRPLQKLNGRKVTNY